MQLTAETIAVFTLLMGQGAVSEIAHSPLVDCILGAALLTLLGFLMWFIRLWREDLRSDRKKSQEISVQTAQVVERNTAAFNSLGEKLEKDSTVSEELIRTMRGRVCLAEQEERYQTLKSAAETRRVATGESAD
jgi:hypothetical protein